MRRAPVFLLVAVTLGLLVAGVISSVLQAGGMGESDLIAVSTFGLGGLSFAAVGALLVLKERGGLVGWLCLAFGFLSGLGLVAPNIEVGWPMLATVAGLLLVFPSGRLPSQRWRWVGWLLLLVSVADTLWAVIVWVFLGGVAPANAENWAWLIGTLLIVPILAAGIIRIINDYRVSRGDIRDQLKWLAIVLLVGSVLLLVSVLPVDAFEGANNVAGIVMLVGGPIAIGLAVLRYRLYEIDRIISRTVSYAVVVGLLGLVFFGVVTLLTSLLPAESDLVVAGSTLAVAALFNPVRRRVHAWVDRRFNRSRYDAQKVMDDFAGSLRDRVDPDGVVEGWVGAVSETMQPTTVAVWVREASA